VHAGRITHEAVAQALDLEAYPLRRP
jgi:hypothetical protein